MKLKQGIITHTIDHEQILVSADKNIFSGIAKSNPTAAFIIDLLKKDISEKEIKDAVFHRYDADYDEISADVDEVLRILRSVNLIDE